MSTALKLRRGTTAQHASFTGAAGEVTLDTDKNTIVVHDGTTAGGFPIARDAQLGTVSSQDADDVAITGGSITGLTSLSTTGNAVISVTDNSNAALRITQLGTGNALLVEDSSNPDSTPFVIGADGKVIVGGTTNQTLLSAENYVQVQQTGAGYAYTAARYTANSNGPAILLGKSRGASASTNTAVIADDTLGSITFIGADGTNFVAGATISAAVDGTPGTTDMPGRLVFSTTADGASTVTERMRIGSDNVTTFGLGSAEAGLDKATVKIRSAAISSSGVATTPRTALELGWQEGSQDLGVGEGTAIAFSVSLTGDSGVYQEVARIGSNKDSSSDSTRTSAIVFETSTDGTTANLTEAVRITSGQGLKISRTEVTSPVVGDGNVFSGTYTPTQVATNTNIATGPTFSAAQYMRVGNTVTVSGQITFTATASATDTTVKISLPIASNFSATRQLSGFGSALNSGLFGTNGMAILGETTNDCAEMRCRPTTTSSISYPFTFTYQVI